MMSKNKDDLTIDDNLYTKGDIEKKRKLRK